MLPVLSSPSTPCSSPPPPTGAPQPLRLSSIPPGRGTITHLDLDLTVACNLACDYCFKEKEPRHLTLKTARDAIVWLIHASGDSPEISLVMIGGEPLLKFDTMTRLIPFAVRRAAQHGKKLHLSMTTNGTVVSDRILDFCKRWGVGFHTSIDGHPAVHDAHRKFKNGKGSSQLLEKNLPRILGIRPGTTARSTVMPDTAGELLASYHYFLQLGYLDVAFVPAAPDLWNEAALAEVERQFEAVGDDVVERFRHGQYIKVKYIDCLCSARAAGRTAMPRPCGVAQGMALVDVDGNLWPCHRWNKQDGDAWRLGSLYEAGFNEAARDPFYDYPENFCAERQCATCIARPICAGGCPAENIEETGDPWLRHPSSCRLHEIFARVGDRVHRTLHEERVPLFMETYYSGTSPAPPARRAGKPGTPPSSQRKEGSHGH